MELSQEQQKAIEQQKEQCIFCQIIAGKIPTKKVYEDKLVIGILDINPATKGHILFMPKEHYPIMLIIPEDTFKHMFSKLKEVDRCVKDALLCSETTIFIANGAAAGQQSSHFMLHIIPREGKDGLDMLDIGEKAAPESEIKEVIEKIGGQLNPLLTRNLPSLGYGKPKIAQKLTKEQLLQTINSNPQIKDMIINNPEQFKKLVPQHPQMKELFSNFNLDEVIQIVNNANKPRKLSVDEILK